MVKPRMERRRCAPPDARGTLDRGGLPDRPTAPRRAPAGHGPPQRHPGRPAGLRAGAGRDRHDDPRQGNRAAAPRRSLDRATAPPPARIRGNVRLVLGMVRANRPWRLVASLSRALVAALGTSAFTLTSPGVWRIANGLSWGRLIALSLGTIAGTCVLIIAVHGLWERSPNQAVREQVVLFNAATALTLAFGISALYVALFLLNSLSGGALIAPSVLEAEIHHPVGMHDYLWLAWLVSSLATIGGALGAAVESDAAVREAAYGFRGADDTRR